MSDFSFMLRIPNYPPGWIEDMWRHYSKKGKETNFSATNKSKPTIGRRTKRDSHGGQRNECRTVGLLQWRSPYLPSNLIPERFEPSQTRIPIWYRPVLSRPVPNSSRVRDQSGRSHYSFLWKSLLGQVNRWPSVSSEPDNRVAATWERDDAFRNIITG